MRQCNIALSILPFLKIVSAFVLPLPVEVGTDVEFDLQITLPYTIIFPTVFFGRRERSLPDSSQSQESSHDIETPLGSAMTKLHSTFKSAGITDLQCQMRLFCKIHREPDKYSSLSDAVFQHMDVRNSMNEIGKDMPHVYSQFLEAGKVGLHPEGNCTRYTEKCQNDPDDDIDWFWVNFFQSVKHISNMVFK